MLNDLRETRKLRIQLRRLKEEKERLATTLASPRLDGMPRGGSGGGIEAQIDMRTELDERIRRTTSEAMKAEMRAREKMDALTPDLYSLCVYYYIGAMTIQETIGILHIARSTFYEWNGRLASMDIGRQCRT